jgi:hypothetical protein
MTNSICFWYEKYTLRQSGIAAAAGMALLIAATASRQNRPSDVAVGRHNASLRWPR